MAVRLVKPKKLSSDLFRYATVATSWGYVAIVARDQRLCRLIMPRARQRSAIDQIKSEFPFAKRDDQLLPKLKMSIKAYFLGQKFDFSCQVELPGASDFYREILRRCSHIKPGQTVSYGELAQKAGFPGAARAVGTIMARNKVPLVIPCHRVVGADGSMRGYSTVGGVDLKKRLLQHEVNNFI